MTIDFSSSRQHNQFRFYVCRTFDKIIEACGFNKFVIQTTDGRFSGFLPCDPTKSEPITGEQVSEDCSSEDEQTKESSKPVFKYFALRGNTLLTYFVNIASFDVAITDLFKVYYNFNNVDFDVLTDYIVMIDSRMLNIFGSTGHVITPYTVSLSYNSFGYVYYNGFLNIFREAAAKNDILSFLATLFRQSGETVVETSSGSDNVVFQISFSDGIFEVLSTNNMQLGYIFIDLFFPVITRKPDPGSLDGRRQPKQPINKFDKNAHLAGNPKIKAQQYVAQQADADSKSKLDNAQAGASG